MADEAVSSFSIELNSNIRATAEEIRTYFAQISSDYEAVQQKLGATQTNNGLVDGLNKANGIIDSLISSFQTLASLSTNDFGSKGIKGIGDVAAQARAQIVELAESIKSLGPAGVPLQGLVQTAATSAASGFRTGATAVVSQQNAAGATLPASVNSTIGSLAASIERVTSTKAVSSIIDPASAAQASLTKLLNDIDQRVALGQSTTAQRQALYNAFQGAETPQYPGLNQIPNARNANGTFNFAGPNSQALTFDPSGKLGLGGIQTALQSDAVAAEAAAASTKAHEQQLLREAAAEEAAAAAEAKRIAAIEDSARRGRVVTSLATGDVGTTAVGTSGLVLSATEGGFVDAQGKIVTSLEQVIRASQAYAAQMEKQAAQQLAVAESPTGFFDSFLGAFSSRGGSRYHGTFGGGGGNSNAGALANLGDTAGVVAKYEILGRSLEEVQRLVEESIKDYANLTTSVANYNAVTGGSVTANGAFVSSLENVAAVAGVNVVDALDAATRGVAAFADENASAAQKQAVGKDFASAVVQNQVITGQNGNESADQLIAVGKSFGIASDGIEEINNAIANAHITFGSDVKDISSGLQLLADDGLAAGYSMTQLAQVVGLDTARLGESGTEVATNLQRVFAQFQGSSGQKALQAIGVSTFGTIKEQIESLAAKWPDLTAKQQQSILATLGGAKAMKELLPLLADNTDLQKSFSNALTNGSAASDLAAAKTHSVAGELKALGREIQNIALDFAKSGVLEPIGLILAAIKPLVTTVDQLIQLFDSIPGVVREPIIVLGELAVAFSLLDKFKATQAFANVSGTLGNVGRFFTTKDAFASLPDNGGRNASQVAAAKDAEAASLAAKEFAGGVAAAGEELSVAQTAFANVAANFEVGSAEYVAAQRAVNTAEETFAAQVRALTAELHGTGAAGAASAAGAVGAAEVTGAAVAGEVAGSGGGAAAEDLLNVRATVVGIQEISEKAVVAEKQAATANEEVAAAARKLAASATTAAEALDQHAASVSENTVAQEENTVAEEANTLADEADTAAVAENAAANAASGLASKLGNFATRTGRGLAGIGKGLFGTLTTPIGAEGGPGLGGIGITALAGAYIDEQFHAKEDAIQKASNNVDNALGAYGNTSPTAASLSDAATQLSTAAAEQRQSSAGFFGTITDGLRQAFGAPSSKSQADAAQAASDTAAANAKKLQDDAAALAKAGVGSASIDLTATDGVKNGLQLLAQTGYTAQQQIDALSESLGQMGKAAQGIRQIPTSQISVFGDKVGANISSNLAERGQLFTQFGGVNQKLGGALLAGGANSAQSDAISKKLQDVISTDHLDSGNLSNNDIHTLEDAAIKATQESYGKAWAKLTTQEQDAAISEARASVANYFNDLARGGQNVVTAQNVDEAVAAAPQLAQQAGSDATVNASLSGSSEGGALAGAKASLADLQKIRAEAAAVGASDQQLAQLDQEIKNTELNVQTATAAHIKALDDLASAQVSQFDKGGQIAAKIKGVQDQLSVTTDADAQAALNAQLAQLTQQQAQQGVTDAAAYTTYAAGNDEVAQAKAALQNANAQLAFEISSGATGADLVAAETTARDAAVAVAQKTADEANAIALAAIDPRNIKAIDVQNLRNIAAQYAATPADDVADRAKLQQQYNQAQLQQQKDQIALANSTIEANITPGNNLSQAAGKLQEAANNLKADLKGTTQYNTDLAAYHQAQYAYAQAVLTQQQEAEKLNIDLTNPVQVAQQAYKDAQAKLAADQKNHTGDTTQDQIDVVNTKAAADAAAFSQQLSDAQTADQLGEISHTAYLKFLQNQAQRIKEQMAGMNQNSQEYRQLQDELNQIGQATLAANQQLVGQFNIGDIKVPTPYEVRRSIATSQAGQHYQSNNSNVVINVNGADYDQVAQLLGTYIGPVTTGQYTIASRKN